MLRSPAGCCSLDAFDLGYGPLNDPTTLRGAVFWALALYVPLSGPLSRFEASLTNGPLSDRWQQITLITSSLLLALYMIAVRRSTYHNVRGETLLLVQLFSLAAVAGSAGKRRSTRKS